MNVTFQLSGSHTQPWEPTSPTPQLHQTNPKYPLTSWSTTHTTSWQDEPNVTHAKLYIYYVSSPTGWNEHTHTHTHTLRSPVFTLRGQWLFFSTGSKVSNKKIQYSKCIGSAAYQYIIQKGDRWQAIRRWKAIKFSVSPYPHYLQMHQSAAVDNWIKKEMWLTSSSKKLKLPAIWRLQTLMGFFGCKNYLWHLHSSASCLHFN